MRTGTRTGARSVWAGGRVAVLLVTNDDGVHAVGLAALAAALEDLGEVHVLAPEREQSACGHALTLHRPLSVHRWGERRHSVNGTPSDCVNLGVLGFLPERPVLVVSGVNHGSNLGDDVTYSGTVSAAMEGTLLGVPSIAVSLVEGEEFADAARVARQVAMRVLVSGLPSMTLLNVNVPAGVPKGVRLTRLGHRVYSGKIVEQADPRGRAHYWRGAGSPTRACSMSCGASRGTASSRRGSLTAPTRTIRCPSARGRRSRSPTSSRS